MRTISPNLKARSIAIAVGLTYVVVALLAMGTIERTEAEDLDARPELERLDEYFDEERQIIDARLCRPLRDCDEIALSSINREALLANRQYHPAQGPSQVFVRQSKSEIQVLE